MMIKETARIAFMLITLIFCVWRLYAFTHGMVPDVQSSVETGAFAGICYTLLGVASINTIYSSIRDIRKWRGCDVPYRKDSPLSKEG